MTSNLDHLQAEADDRAFAVFVRQLELPLHDDLAVAEIQQSALSALIATYALEDADSGIAGAIGQLLADGADIDVLRNDFARAAGLADLEMLRRFWSLDARLESGEAQTIDITGLSDDELLKLFS